MNHLSAPNGIILELAHDNAFQLQRCRGRHAATMRTCDPGAFACHDDFCPPDEDGASNPVLIYVPVLRGTTPLAGVDMAEVDTAYELGERTVRLHAHHAVFRTAEGEPVTIYTVTETGRHDVCYVAAYVCEQAARTAFERGIQP